jgi:GGDEF domain-containing protein
MGIAASAALAAVSALALGVLAVRALRARADRRFEEVLRELDRHMRAISTSLHRVVERTAQARARSVDELELTIDFGELLRRIAAEAAARTYADAAAVRVLGPGGATISATFGASDRGDLPEAPLAQNAGAFRAVTVNWTYRPGAGQDEGDLASALVVPILESGVHIGTIAAYVPADGTFGSEQMQTLERLADEAAPAIASARRFAEAQLALTDPGTGLRNAKGYHAELERAVAHAAETAEPLSLLVLPHAARAGEEPEAAVHDLAKLLARLTRTADVVCRRGTTELAVILSATTGEAARSFHLRTLEAASQAGLMRPSTFDAGLAEWRPGEEAVALDARAAASVGRSRLETIALRAGGGNGREPPESPEAFRAQLVREIAAARQLDRPLSLLVMDVVDELRRVGDEHGPDAAEETRAAVEERFRANVQNGTASSWIGDEALTVILSGSTAADAEGMFAALQAGQSAESRLEWPAVSAGVTELAWGDDAASVYGRARHALWRAKRAGRGTVVVAMAAEDPRS